MGKKRKQTTVAKAVDAAHGKRPKKGRRSLYDSPAKRLIATRYILAWIVKTCVSQASDLTIREIALNCIDPEVSLSATPVYREDAEAEDPGRVRMEQTEDTSLSEGTVRYDILFTLHLPAEPNPITVIINVELQNRAQLEYPLSARGMSYAGRLLGQQGPNYAHLRKVYSIWIVSNPPKSEENTLIRYFMVRKVEKAGALEQAATDTGSASAGSWGFEMLEAEADLMEVDFLNLGDPQLEQAAEHPTALELLDVLFSGSLNQDEIKRILKTNFNIPVTKQMEEDMDAMHDARFGFEVAAETRGRKEGLKKGLKKGLNKGLKKGRKLGTAELLYRQVKDKTLTLSEAAAYAGLTKAEFKANMKKYDAAQASAD